MTSLVREGERLDELFCKGMKIIQDPSAPCFSIDAVLLADFARCQPRGRLIDLGSGTGVMALLLAARYPDCRVEAVELMPAMADMASRSVKLNGLEDRVRIRQGDLRQATEYYGAGVFDAAVANPPYYKLGAGRLSRDPLRAAARSEQYCTLPQLFAAAASLLKPLGELFIVHRAERRSEALELAEAAGLAPGYLRMVRPQAARPANLLLASFVKDGPGRDWEELPELTIYDSPGRYSREMQAIYQGSTS